MSDALRSRSSSKQKISIGALCSVILITIVWNATQIVSIWRDETSIAGWHNHDTTALQHGPGPVGAALSFNITKATVPKEEILAGGPPKDGIPAISNPRFIEASKADYLSPSDRVIGIVADDETRAYPLKILNLHEIVNDRIGEQPIVVTYCPLCDSAAVFDRNTPVGLREFGVSGLLYNSNMLMYDRTDGKESLWSQVKGQGISGPGADKSLKSLPMELTTWQAWRERHAETTVLSTDTGFGENYNHNPYAYYFERPGLSFPAKPLSDRLAEKDCVLGIWTDQTARAYPVAALGGQSQKIIDEIDGEQLVIEFDPESESLRVVDAPDSVQWMYSFWFVWHAMRPETELYQLAVE